jgi:ketosteroid isomerase-like protein
MTDLKELERRYYEALNARAFERYDELFHQDVTLWSVGRIEGEGIDALRMFDMGWAVVAFPDAVLDVQFQVEDGDRVVSRNTLTGTHTGVLHTSSGDIAPTGVRFEGEPYWASLQARGGKFCSVEIYYDRMQVAELLGLVPEPTNA